MSERLTEPGQDFELQFCRESGCEYYGEPEGCNHPNYVCPSNCYFTAVAEKLQKYEDLEEQGRLVKLPCKVGDRVFTEKLRKEAERIGKERAMYDIQNKVSYIWEYIKEQKANAEDKDELTENDFEALRKKAMERE